MPLSGERRWSTILFADLVGFTRFCEGRDPEEVQAVVDRCMSTMGDIVHRLGGFVTRVIGDELMAVFGAPIAHDDDPERAVRAGLEMQRRAAHYPEDFGGLKLRVGINSGDAIFGPIGPRQARQPTVMGDAVNVASRLQLAAPDGGVLVGDETYRASRHSIHYEALDALQVKGKQVAVGVWLATGAAAAVAERPLSAAPMLGRDADLGLLVGAWEMALVDRRPRLVTIWGAPGIGKTRLVREFTRRVEARSGRVLIGRSLPYGESFAYEAFAQQLRTLAGIYLTDAAPTARAKLARTVAALVPAHERRDVTQSMSLLAGLASETWTSDRNSLFFGARQFVEAVSQSAPTLFVFEDLHWANPSLLDLIESIATRSTKVPALFVGIARPELLHTRPNWGEGQPGSSEVRLEALPNDEAKDLAKRLSIGVNVSDGDLDQILRRAEGNPLFVEELMRSLADHSATLRDVPPTIWAVIAARLDRLPEFERRVVREASVVGRIFWRGALEVLIGDADAVARAILLLEAQGLVRTEPTSRLEGDDEFAFGHALFREVAYATLPLAARRERHAAVARYLEERHRDRPSASAAMLAHHWREAGAAELAARYLIVAADEAAGAGAMKEAVALYAQALELLPDEDTARRNLVHLKSALAMVDSGDFRAASTALEPLVPQLDGADAVAALVAQSRAVFWTMDTERAQLLARRAVEMADELGDEVLRVSAMSQLSISLSTLPTRTRDGIAEGEAALAVWPTGSRPVDLATHLGSLGTYYGWTGDYERGEQRARAGYELAEKANQVDAMLIAASHLGVNLTGLGRHDEALEILERAAVQGKQLELVPRFTSRIMNMWAGTLRELFLVEEARRRSEEAIEMSKRSGFPFSRGQALVDLLFLDLVEGEIGRADSSWRAVLELAESMRGWHHWLMIGRVMAAKAEIALRMGRSVEAAEAAGAAMAYAIEVGRPKYEVMARATLGSALLAAGKAGEAIEELRAARAGAERLKHPPSIWDVESRLGEALAASGHEMRSQAAFGAARQSIEKFASHLSAARREAFLSARQVREVLDHAQ
ncbi:MAG TPA: adenylate/guanylate cyclase domain-containing protein [Candidatus Dormibacteraeota bacterium]|nr:adenylate/guanylate cyclase domain-containing protein [Candidatus Dormibacteraeota bacterium]